MIMIKHPTTDKTLHVDDAIFLTNCLQANASKEKVQNELPITSGSENALKSTTNKYRKQIDGRC